MGQLLSSYISSQILARSVTNADLAASSSDTSCGQRTFVDLKLLPPELALTVLSNLNATDLCLASCVWRDLATDELLWQGLCRTTWPFCSAYRNWQESPDFSFRLLYLRLDEARLTFNADAFEGVRYMIKQGIVEDTTEDLVAYLHTAPGLNATQKRRFLEHRPLVLDGIIQLKNFEHHFLPNALRSLFHELPAPPSGRTAPDFVTFLLEKFSERFCSCNPTLGFSRDEIYLLCFSLIMLSVDLWSPHVKTKMSKREFIRNTRHVAARATDEFLGHLYDNIYMVGHVAVGDIARPVRRLSSRRRVHVY